MSASVVEVITGSASSGTSCSATMTTTPAAGDTLIAVVANSNGVSPTGISGCGATWTKKADDIGAANTSGKSVSVWEGQSPSSSGAVTATFAASGRQSINVFWVRGTSGTTVAASTTRGSISTLDGPSTSAGAGQLVIDHLTTYASSSPTRTHTPSSGWTDQSVATLATFMKLTSGWIAPGSSGTFTTAWAGLSAQESVAAQIVIGGAPAAANETSFAVVAPKPVAALAASVILAASMVAVAPKPLAAFGADVAGIASASFAVVAPKPVAAFGVSPVVDVTATAVAAKPVASFVFARDREMGFAVVAPRPVATFAVGGVALASFAVVAPSPQATATMGLPVGAQRNRVGGRLRTGLGDAVGDPAPTAPPASTPSVVAYDTAVAYGAVTITKAADGRVAPRFTTSTAKTPRQRDRILVGGRDVTYFRGVPTPCPDYTLLQPFAYGSGTLTLPQVFPIFERLGVGDLKWLKPGARVKVQRVDTSTNKVVATDYVGFISAFDTSGPGLVCDLGGELTGRGAMTDKPVPIFRSRTDVGHLIWQFVVQNGARFAPRAPAIGITLNVIGGMTQLDWANQVMGQAVTVDGQEWTCMPDAKGVYRLALKDTTTVAATIYFEAGQTPADMRRDLAEEPNRIYATGVNDNGRRIKNARYPGLVQGPPPPYPFHDGRSFGVGTTNDDTDDPAGDLITAMNYRLFFMGYLDLEDVAATYTDTVASVVRGLQLDAGFLVQTGVMNPATWNALYDLSATGYSLRGAEVLPFAQNDNVRKWNRTSSGALISRNHNCDPNAIPVDLTLDVGTGFNRKQIAGFARSKLASGANWAGTVDLSLAVIAGDHGTGTPITAADVMPSRALRPGMNVRAPGFQGGTLFHVSGVSVSEQGSKVTLMLDTQARDTIAAWEVIARNRETRRNPARVWIANHRGSTTTKDALGEWDAIGGVLSDRVRLAGQHWTVFPVVAGQEGIVQAIDLTTLNPHSEFVVAVFGRQVSPSWLQARIPNPLTKAGTKKWESQAFRSRLDNKVLLYIAGADSQPCGYWPGEKTDASGATKDPLTGRWYDDAGFAFRTFAGGVGSGVLWVAIWADKACTLKGGRIMQNQEGAGA